MRFGERGDRRFRENDIARLIDKNHVGEKSRQRVKDHGEVFTRPPIVAAMLDLAAHETERIDSRFLEPACGTGNFLVEVLRRKLALVEARYRRSQIEYERYAIVAASSIYGVDLLKDNVEECRKQLFRTLEERYERLYKSKCNDSCSRAVNFILKRNILWGDALTLRMPDTEALPIIFSEWSAISGSHFKRRDFTLANLLENSSPERGSLFEPMGEQAFIPTPVAEYPAVHFSKLEFQ